MPALHRFKKTNMRKTIYLAGACALLLAGCSNTDNPQLAMCQAVTKQLVGDTVSNWDEVSEADIKKIRSIDINFTQADGSTSQINCGFPIKENGDVDTSPTIVLLNGQQVEKKTLLKAGLKASGDLLKGTAAATVAKSKELADEAKVIAADAADKAREGAADASKIAGEVADKAREGAADASAKATELADKAADGLTQKAGELTEIARDKALQATESIQKKLEN
jgi:hypothetical protein